MSAHASRSTLEGDVLSCVYVPPTNDRRVAWERRFCGACGCDFQAAAGIEAGFCSLECETGQANQPERTHAQPRLKPVTKRGVREGKSQLDRTYRIWVGMVVRGTSLRARGAENYAGRSIDCDPRWAMSYDCFVADMGSAPAGMTIERIDNDKGYWPHNCRWANQHDQQRNKRNNVWVSLHGNRMVFEDAVKLLGTYSTRLRYYMNRDGIDHQSVIDQLVSAGKPDIFFASQIANSRQFQQPKQTADATEAHVSRVQQPVRSCLNCEAHVPLMHNHLCPKCDSFEAIRDAWADHSVLGE